MPSAQDDSAKLIGVGYHVIDAGVQIGKFVLALGEGAGVGAIAGPIGAIIGAVIGLLQYLASLYDPTLDDLIKSLRQLKIAVVEQSILERLQLVDAAMGDAQTAWTFLIKDRIGLDKSVSWDYATGQIADCVSSLTKFFPSEASNGFGPVSAPFWFAVRDLQAPLYYAGDQQLRGVPPPWQNWANPTGATTLPEGLLEVRYAFAPLTFATDLTPLPDQNGFVFNHLGILPEYMRALGILMVVGQTLSSSFTREHAYELAYHAEWLAVLHTMIWSGVVCSTFVVWDIDAYQLIERPRSVFVETFGGAHSGEIEMEAPTATDRSQSYYGRWLVRLLWQSRVFYRQVGLDDIRAAVNGYCDAVGRPRIFAGASFTTSSVRDAIGLLRSWERGMSASKMYAVTPWPGTVRSLRQMLFAADVPVSMRAMLRG